MSTASDVARLAGTSTAVVSYVFNDGPRGVAPATRDRVLEAAERLQYRPNNVARALSAGRTDSIGLVVPDITNPFFGELARALETAVAPAGKLLLIGDSAMDLDREDRLIDAFVARRVDALVFASQRRAPNLSSATQQEIPCVALHPVAADVLASSVSIDYGAAAGIAVRHLVANGASHVGMLNSPTGEVTSEDRSIGFSAALDAANVQSSTREVEMTRRAAYDACLEWLSTRERPDAIFAACDEQAFGVLAAAHELALRVPEDLLVVALDGTEAGRFAIPTLTSVAQPIESLAARAAELALHPGQGVRHEQLPFTLTVRASAPAPTPRPRPRPRPTR
jgi:LacI family transcriptional regulator